MNEKILLYLIFKNKANCQNIFIFVSVLLSLCEKRRYIWKSVSKQPMRLVTFHFKFKFHVLLSGVTIGAGYSLAQLNDALHFIVSEQPKEKTKTYHALLKHLRTLAGAQIRNMAVCALVSYEIRLCQSSFRDGFGTMRLYWQQRSTHLNLEFPQAPVSSLRHVIGLVLGSVLKEVFFLMAHGKAIFPQAISLNWHQRGGNLAHCVVWLYLAAPLQVCQIFLWNKEENF